MPNPICDQVRISHSSSGDPMFSRPFRAPRFDCLAVLLAASLVAQAQLKPSPRPSAPTRDPHTPGYVQARELPDGQLPPADADGLDWMLFAALDSLIAAKRIPSMIGISIANGGQDAQGSERGLEYDTMSGRYAEFVETEVLPRVEAEARVRLTHDPDGRAATGGSSGAACAFIMAWYHPELYHRVLLYSGTFTNQQWPFNPATPHGAWEFPEHLVADTPRKPIRIWMEVGDRDLFNPNAMRDGMHDWVVANERMASALAAKGYHYQFVFAENAGHVDHATKLQTLPEALEFVWQGYREGGGR